MPRPECLNSPRHASLGIRRDSGGTTWSEAFSGGQGPSGCGEVCGQGLDVAVEMELRQLFLNLDYWKRENGKGGRRSEKARKSEKQKISKSKKPENRSRLHEVPREIEI